VDLLRESAVKIVRDIAIPDIGDFKDIAIIELRVKPGDVVPAEDTLLVLESDKAVLEVPVPGRGHSEGCQSFRRRPRAPGDGSHFSRAAKWDRRSDLRSECHVPTAVLVNRQLSLRIVQRLPIGPARHGRLDSRGQASNNP
jgi:Biotin-requiring enzyme